MEHRREDEGQQPKAASLRRLQREERKGLLVLADEGLLERSVPPDGEQPEREVPQDVEG